MRPAKLHHASLSARLHHRCSDRGGLGCSERERDEFQSPLTSVHSRGSGDPALGRVLDPWIRAFAGMNGDWFNGGANLNSTRSCQCQVRTKSERVAWAQKTRPKRSRPDPDPIPTRSRPANALVWQFFLPSSSCGQYAPAARVAAAVAGCQRRRIL
jgi:hypothetical protein